MQSTGAQWYVPVAGWQGYAYHVVVGGVYMAMVNHCGDNNWQVYSYLHGTISFASSGYYTRDAAYKAVKPAKRPPLRRVAKQWARMVNQAPGYGPRAVAAIALATWVASQHHPVNTHGWVWVATNVYSAVEMQNEF